MLKKLFSILSIVITLTTAVPYPTFSEQLNSLADRLLSSSNRGNYDARASFRMEYLCNHYVYRGQWDPVSKRCEVDYNKEAICTMGGGRWIEYEKGKYYCLCSDRPTLECKATACAGVQGCKPAEYSEPANNGVCPSQTYLMQKACDVAKSINSPPSCLVVWNGNSCLCTSPNCSSVTVCAGKPNQTTCPDAPGCPASPDNNGQCVPEFQLAQAACSIAASKGYATWDPSTGQCICDPPEPCSVTVCQGLPNETTLSGIIENGVCSVTAQDACSQADGVNNCSAKWSGGKCNCSCFSGNATFGLHLYFSTFKNDLNALNDKLVADISGVHNPFHYRTFCLMNKGHEPCLGSYDTMLRRGMAMCSVICEMPNGTNCFTPSGEGWPGIRVPCLRTPYHSTSFYYSGPIDFLLNRPHVACMIDQVKAMGLYDQMYNFLKQNIAYFVAQPEKLDNYIPFVSFDYAYADYEGNWDQLPLEQQTKLRKAFESFESMITELMFYVYTDLFGFCSSVSNGLLTRLYSCENDKTIYTHPICMAGEGVPLVKPGLIPLDQALAFWRKHVR